MDFPTECILDQDCGREAAWNEAEANSALQQGTGAVRARFTPHYVVRVGLSNGSGAVEFKRYERDVASIPSGQNTLVQGWRRACQRQVNSWTLWCNTMFKTSVMRLVSMSEAELVRFDLTATCVRGSFLSPRKIFRNSVPLLMSDVLTDFPRNFFGVSSAAPCSLRRKSPKTSSVDSALIAKLATILVIRYAFG